MTKAMRIAGLMIVLVASGILVIGVFKFMNTFSESTLRIERPVVAAPRNPGQIVPLFSGYTIEGTAVNFDLRFLNSAEKTVVVFWASWCPPCAKETPSLVALAKRQKRWRIVAVSNDSTMDDIKSFLRLFPEMRSENIFILWDSSRELANAFGVVALPESFIVDANGRLERKFQGAVDWNQF